MTHVLVFWIEENKYSVVPISKVQHEVVPDENLVGKVVPVRWKQQFYQAEIKAIGSKVDVKEQEAYWEKVAIDTSFNASSQQSRPTSSLSSSRDLPDDPKLILVSADDMDVSGRGDPEESAIDTEDVSNTTNPNDTIRKLMDEIKRKDIMYAKEKAKNKLLRRMAKKSIPTDSSAEMVDIGGGININRKFDDLLKLTFRGNPSLFLRKLVFDGGILTLEEVAASSITGSKTILSPNHPRPALDPTKFKGLKDYTIQSCGLRPDTVDMLQFESRIRSICTDARKKLKRLGS